LFFADDSLLFCRANFTEWGRLLGILSWYEKASGQKLNAAKTSIFFSKNTGAEFKDFLRSSAGISTTSSYDKYLGLPALVGRSKNKTFAVIEGRVRKKMDGWKEKFLSQAGKEILIKAVVQAIPTYSMSVFQLPKKLCNSLNSLVSRFWWGQNTMDELDKVRSFKIPRWNGVLGLGSFQQSFVGKTRVEIDEVSKLFICSNIAGQILSKRGFFESSGRTTSFLCMAKHSSSPRSVGEGNCLEGGKWRTY